VINFPIVVVLTLRDRNRSLGQPLS